MPVEVDLHHALRGFTGTDAYHQHWLPHVLCTDGVAYLMEHGQCYWLVDASRPTWGKQLSGQLLSKRWRTAIKALGKERVRQLSVHSGRHSFASLSLESGRSLAEVRDALGHKNIMTTSVYLHCLSRNVPDVFAASQSGVAR